MIDVGLIQETFSRLAFRPAARSVFFPSPDSAIPRLQNGQATSVRLCPAVVANRGKLLSVIAAKPSEINRKSDLPVSGRDDFADVLTAGLWQINGNDFELQSIEAHQSVLRAQPEIAVLGLGDGVDLVRRQAVLGGPVLAIELED